jgi:hypothetical protein
MAHDIPKYSGWLTTFRNNILYPFSEYTVNIAQPIYCINKLNIRTSERSPANGKVLQCPEDGGTIFL